VNFTAYFKETDQSSHLMQQKLTGPHTTWELTRQTSRCTRVGDTCGRPHAIVVPILVSKTLV